jgi:nitrate/nitrite transporter NarK
MKMEMPVFKNRPWADLASASLYFDVSFLAWTFWGLLRDLMAFKFALTPMQKGLITALPQIGRACMRLFAGRGHSTCDLPVWIEPGSR